MGGIPFYNTHIQSKIPKDFSSGVFGGDEQSKLCRDSNPAEQSSRGFSPSLSALYSVVIKSQKSKIPKDFSSGVFGGEGGIRTLVGVLAQTRFPVVRLRPAQPPLQVASLDDYNMIPQNFGFVKGFLKKTFKYLQKIRRAFARRILYQAFPWVANQPSLDWLILMPGPMVDAITQDLMY